jgi:hypothetical protein
MITSLDDTTRAACHRHGPGDQAGAGTPAGPRPHTGQDVAQTTGGTVRVAGQA